MLPASAVRRPTISASDCTLTVPLLQVQSANMSTKLRNRRVAEDKLGTFLEQALVSEDLIHQVMDAPVSAGVLITLLPAAGTHRTFCMHCPAECFQGFLLHVQQRHRHKR